MRHSWETVVRLLPVVFVAGLAYLVLSQPPQMVELYLIDIETFTNRLIERGAADKPLSFGLVPIYLGAGLPILVAMAFGLVATLFMWLGGLHLLALGRNASAGPRTLPVAGCALVVLLALAPVVGVLGGLFNALGVAEAAMLRADVWRYIAATACILVLQVLLLGLLTYLLRPTLERIAERLSSPVGFGIGALAIVAFSLAVVWWPTALPWALGTPATVFLFLASLSFVLVGFARAYHKTGIPVTVLVVACAVFFSAMGWTDNHKVAHTLGNQQMTTEQGFVAWLRQRPDRDHYAGRGKPYPVYLVAAEGGGIYAGYHVASFLARMQATCPNFAQHVFAISSVSGGSLGAAAFAAHVHNGLEGTGAVASRDVACESEIVEEGPVVEGISEYFRSDFLSPLVAATLFPDMLQRLIPYPIAAFDRARGLERGIADARAQFFTANSKANPFDLSINSVWDAAGSVPALFLNATSVEMGARITMGPLVLSATPTALHISALLCNGARAVHTSLASAVSLSARFPLLTPAGWIYKSPENSSDCGEAPKTRTGAVRDKLYLVDGGYFENSGLELAIEMAARLRAMNRQCQKARSDQSMMPPAFCSELPEEGFEIRTIMVFALDDYAYQIMGAYADLSAGQPGEILAPVVTMLNARRARTRAIHLRQSFFDDDYQYLVGLPSQMLAKHSRYVMPDTPFLGHDDIHHVMLDGSKSFLPLGWRLSHRSMVNIAESRTEATKMTFELIRRELLGEDTENIKRPATR
ncbi:MAG: hypothetical protein RLZ98_2430 [Pseudomonadota bacterium]|jgi:hypothetical protein